MRTPLIAAAALVSLATGYPAAADHHTAGEMSHHNHAAMQAMESALSEANRSEDRTRDAYRHPAETLAFFQVEPGMTVVDYMPAGGWYTRVLVPYLGSEGRYVGIMPDPANADNPRMAEYFGGLPGGFSESYPGWNLTGAPISGYASGEVPEDMAGTVDRALIFREMHNLHRSGVLHAELTRLRSMLKDDGMLGIVQHRAKENAPASYTDGSKGYLRQKDVIALVEAHGFELVDTSEVNANPKDTANWENGVWELPPSLGSKREELKQIGESDRMTLLFRKRA
ncbi:class I SAM-dependent methyltransferase [Qipengyuania atrilutea]|uniref:Methyltransferase n=1 Tax=Qipengyuania atrilutea TaxID=2744473 RepID=A0A850H6J2_9SPHN|nr:hypothetical protein [Actirhodobacter atriluteus]NVD46097.1 hypothetical protein [Actirhodobacter atriluteus]